MKRSADTSTMSGDLTWFTVPAGTKLFHGDRNGPQPPHAPGFMFATEFSTAFGYAGGKPERLQVLTATKPLRLLVMDRANMRAIRRAANAGRLPLLLAYSMAQVTGYGLTESQYYRNGTELKGGRPKLASAYGIITGGQRTAGDSLYAAGRLAELVCKHLDGDGWIYPPYRFGTSSVAEYSARRRSSGFHFHDEVMLCAAAVASSCSVQPIGQRELARLKQGWPGPDPADLWVDDWMTHAGFANHHMTRPSEQVGRSQHSTAAKRRRSSP